MFIIEYYFRPGHVRTLLSKTVSEDITHLGNRHQRACPFRESGNRECAWLWATMLCTVFVVGFGPRYFSPYVYPQTSHLNLELGCPEIRNAKAKFCTYYPWVLWKKDSFCVPCIFTWNSRRKNAEQFFMRCITSVSEVRAILDFTHSSLFRLSNLIPSKCCLTTHNLSFIKNVNKLCNTEEFNVPIKIQRKYIINMVTNNVFSIIKSIRFFVKILIFFKL